MTHPAILAPQYESGFTSGVAWYAERLDQSAPVADRAAETLRRVENAISRMPRARIVNTNVWDAVTVPELVEVLREVAAELGVQL